MSSSNTSAPRVLAVSLIAAMAVLLLSVLLEDSGQQQILIVERTLFIVGQTRFIVEQAGNLDTGNQTSKQYYL